LHPQTDAVFYNIGVKAHNIRILAEILDTAHL
jgi:hypothetical protein